MVTFLRYFIFIFKNHFLNWYHLCRNQLPESQTHFMDNIKSTMDAVSLQNKPNKMNTFFFDKHIYLNFKDSLSWREAAGRVGVLLQTLKKDTNKRIRCNEIHSLPSYLLLDLDDTVPASSSNCKSLLPSSPPSSLASSHIVSSQRCCALIWFI